MRSDFSLNLFRLLLLCGGDTKFELPKDGNGNVLFLVAWVRFAREGKAVVLQQYHEQ